MDEFFSDAGGEFTQHALWALWAIAFTESSFFLIPPDIPMILMAVAKPSMAYQLALICTIGSVLGAMLGYAIGMYGGRPIVEWLVSVRWFRWIFDREKFEMVESYYQKYDVWAVLVAAFTPLPYKIFTIAGGLCRIRFWPFILISIVGRAGRFFLVGTVLYFFGEQAQPLLKHFDKFLLGMLVLVAVGFFAMRYIKFSKEEKA